MLAARARMASMFRGNVADTFTSLCDLTVLPGTDIIGPGLDPPRKGVWSEFVLGPPLSRTLPFPLVTADPVGRPLPSAVSRTYFQRFIVLLQKN